MLKLSQSILGAAVLLGCSLLTTIAAAEPRAMDETYIGVVTADNVYVRSGASDGYYPFGRVHKGDLVRVIGERYNFARVKTVGPSFPQQRFFGYLIYPKTQPGRFRLADNRSAGTTLSRMDVLAPNLTTDFNPNDSWKPIARLDADTRVKVLKTSETLNNMVVHIVLPEEAEGWINMQYVRRANEDERIRWERIVRGMPAEATPEAAEEPEPKPETKPETTPGTKPEATTETKPAVAQETKPVETDEEVEQPAEVVESEATDPKPLARDTPDEIVIREPDTPAAEPMPETQAEPKEEPLAERFARATLEDLEAAFEALREEPVETAEVDPLRRMYLDLAQREEESEGTARFANARAEQLRIWAAIQRRRVEIAELRMRAQMAENRTEAVRLAIDAEADYTAVGRLVSSTVYDGRRLPLLMRLQDAGSGRTVAYIEPDDGFNLDGMMGQLIGVVGDRAYDGGLRLNVIRPRRIDILAPRGPAGN